MLDKPNLLLSTQYLISFIAASNRNDIKLVAWCEDL